MTKKIYNNVYVGFDSNMESGFHTIPHCERYASTLTRFNKEFRVSLFGLFIAFHKQAAVF